MFYSNIPMTDDQLLKHAPAVFGREKYSKRKENYQLFSTYDIIQGMRKEGFEVAAAMQGGARADGSAPAATRAHVVRFRASDYFGAGLDVGESIPEIVLINSHDGSTQFDISAGIFRKVCTNGLMVETCASGIHEKIRHMGHTFDEVIEAAVTVGGKTAEIKDNILQMQSIELDSRAMRDFLHDSLELKYGEDWRRMNMPNPEALLEARREDDYKNTLWNVFNRVQENMLKGGVRVNQRLLRPITNINEGARLNRGLWNIADNYRLQLAA